MKTLLKITDGTPIKDALVNLAIWWKFDRHFFLIRIIKRLPIPSGMKWDAIVSLRKKAGK